MKLSPPNLLDRLNRPSVRNVVVALALLMATAQLLSAAVSVTPTNDDGVPAALTPTPNPTPFVCNLSENFDGVIAPALPSGWVTANAAGGAPLWITSTTTPDSAPNDAFIDDPATVSDKRLDTPGIAIVSTQAFVSFRNNFALEPLGGGANFFDGAVLEVSSPNIAGGAFTDITNAAVGGSFITGGYNGTISTAFSNPIAGRMAWSQSSGGYINTVANLGPNVNGQTIKLRFRMCSDSSGSATGWRIDSIVVNTGVQDCGWTPTPSPTAGTPTPTPSPIPACTPTSQGFDDITTLPSLGWVQTNHSTTIGTTGWFQGNSAVFPAQSGATTSYIGANFNNTTNADTISNWLLTPPLPLQNGVQMTFWIRTVDAPAFPDRLQVRMSTNGTSINVGTLATDVGDFTTLLLDINPTYTTSGYPNVWTQFTVTVSGLGSPATGRFALRYFVENGGPSGTNSDYIGIDTFQAGFCGDPFPTPTPTPTPSPTPIELHTPTPSPTATPTPMTPTPTLTPCPGTLISENFDGVTPPALPPGWSGDGWVTSNSGVPAPPADSLPNAAFADDQDSIGNKILSPPAFTVTSASAVLSFRNNFDMEFSGGVYWDGGVLEVSSPNISSGDYLDITDSHVGGSIVSGGYTGEISGDSGNPLAGRMAWAGSSGGFISTVINLGPNLAGQTITLRFRMGTDEAVAAPGWRIDTFLITDGSCGTPTPTPGTATPTPTPGPPTPTPGTPTPTPGIPTPTPSPTPIPATRAINLSTRMRVQTGDNVGIGGFIITGTAPKEVLLRAIGPSLSSSGIVNPLADPVLGLHGPGGFATITNNNWRDTQGAEIQATGIAPANDLESAILVTLDPGAYTAIVRGNGNSSGVALVEIYDLGQGAASKLGNISTRAFVSTGSDIVIAGFILGNGGSADRVLIRGIGPSLSAAGLSPVLADPTLELRDSNGALIRANNDWQSDPIGPPLPPGLAPGNPLESVIVATLPPGLYTALLSGVNNGTGLGLVEVYDDPFAAPTPTP